jgi:hypothetical protein
VSPQGLPRPKNSPEHFLEVLANNRFTILGEHRKSDLKRLMSRAFAADGMQPDGGPKVKPGR